MPFPMAEKTHSESKSFGLSKHYKFTYQHSFIYVYVFNQMVKYLKYFVGNLSVVTQKQIIMCLQNVYFVAKQFIATCVRNRISIGEG